MYWNSLLTSRVASLQLQDAEAERRRRIARLQAVVITLENLLIRPAGEPPDTEGSDSGRNRRTVDAEGGITAATSSKRRRRLGAETLMAT